MGDHFVLLVDRLITESTIEAAIQSRNRMLQPVEECTVLDEKTLERLRNGDPSLSMAECRICHDDDLDSNMETPCSCSGSLKYAHRRCVQRWCNEKGDIMCEICHQEFKPDYTAPPPLVELGHVPFHFRGNWGISRGFIRVVPADSSFIEQQQYSISSTTTFFCCRSLVLIFMALLILRHTLPLVLTASSLHVFPLFTLLFVRVIGIMLPIYIVTKAVATCRRHSQPLDVSHSQDSSDDETDSWPLPQSQSYIIGVQ